MKNLITALFFVLAVVALAWADQHFSDDVTCTNRLEVTSHGSFVSGGTSTFTGTEVHTGAATFTGTLTGALTGNAATATSATTAGTITGTIDTSKVIGGPFATAMIPNQDTSKITGTFLAASIAAAQIDTTKIKTSAADSGMLMTSCAGVALWRAGGLCP